MYYLEIEVPEDSYQNNDSTQMYSYYPAESIYIEVIELMDIGGQLTSAIFLRTSLVSNIHAFHVYFVPGWPR